jgi:hypothetical protein
MFVESSLYVLCKQRLQVLRFEVITAATLKNFVFWDVSQCGSCRNQCFGGMCPSIFRIEKSVGVENVCVCRSRVCSRRLRWLSTLEDFLSSRILLFRPWSDTFLRIVGFHKSHMAPHPRRHSSTFTECRRN